MLVHFQQALEYWAHTNLLLRCAVHCMEANEQYFYYFLNLMLSKPVCWNKWSVNEHLYVTNKTFSATTTVIFDKF